MIFPLLAACCLQEIPTESPQISSGPPPDLRASDSSPDSFIGSRPCRQCHAGIYRSWERSPHSHGLSESARSTPPHKGSCDRCHTTGGIEEGVGCEACHGPRSAHIGTRSGRQSVDCGLCEIQKQCIQCHNRSIDPGFDAGDDWSRIDHGRNKQ